MYYNIPTQINTVQNDFAFAWKFTLQDSTGSPIDISGASLNFVAQLDSNETVSFRNPMTVISGPAGTCAYTVASTDFVVAGTYNAQIEANFGSGSEIVTWTGITINVSAKLPIS